MLIVVDGAVDLPPELEGSPSVRVVPSQVWVDEEPWAGDRREFWDRLRAGDHFSTSPPTVAALAAAYADGDPVIAVHVSAELSATVARAEQAAADRGTVTVVDSRSLSVGAGLLAAEVASAARPGVPAEVIAARARKLPSRLHTLALVQDTATLQRSGRAGLLPPGHLARGRPLLLSLRGRAIPLEQVRDRAHALGQLIRHALDVSGSGGISWALGHGECHDVTEITSRLAGHLGGAPRYVTALDPAVGAHVGPDAIIVGLLA